MSNLQKEGAGYASIGRHYRKVAVIFDKLPPRFKFMDARPMKEISPSKGFPTRSPDCTSRTSGYQPGGRIRLFGYVDDRVRIVRAFGQRRTVRA